MSYELLFQRAVQLHEAGQLNEAEQIYRRILETAPQQPEVLNLLGLVAQAKGVQDEACSLFYQAIRQAPARAPFYYNLAFSLKLDNKPVEALESFEKALALQPDILLMDEPTSALDPIATKHIEELLIELKKEVTILIVTHNMSQAKRISDRSMFMFLGELIEYDETQKMFTNPNDERTRAYLTGKMG